MDTSSQILSIIGLAFNLSHLIVVRDEGLGRPGVKNSPMPLVDLGCEKLFLSFPAYSKHRGPVVNIAILCPGSLIVNSTGRWEENQRLTVTETSVDPLAHPMVNLIIVDGSYAYSQYLVTRFGRMAMLKTILLVTINDSSNQSKACSSAVLRTVTGETAEVACDCTYSGNRQLLSETFTGFGGRHFTVATIISNHFDQTMDNETGEWSGYTIDVLQGLALALHFGYTLVTPEDGQYGIEENGNWTGMVGLLLRKEADMVVSSLLALPSRARVVDFTQSYFKNSIGVHIVVPDGLHSTFSFNMSDTERNVILAILFAFLLVGIVLSIFHRISTENTDVSLIGWIFNVFGLLFSQGIHSKISLTGARILISASVIIGLIYMAAYSGTLIASFSTMAAPAPPFTTIKGLVKDDTYTLLSVKGSVMHQYLQETNEGIVKGLFGRINRFGDDKDFMSLAHQGDMVAIINDALLSKIVYDTEGVCNIMTLQDTFMPAGVAAALPKGSPFENYFSKVIQQMSDSGLLLGWKKRNKPISRCMGVKPTGHQHRSITLEDVYVIFIFLMLAIFLAFIVLAVENVIAKCTRRIYMIT